MSWDRMIRQDQRVRQRLPLQGRDAVQKISLAVAQRQRAAAEDGNAEFTPQNLGRSCGSISPTAMPRMMVEVFGRPRCRLRRVSIGM